MSEKQGNEKAKERKKGNKVEERKDKKEAPEQQTMGLEWQRGWLMYGDVLLF